MGIHSRLGGENTNMHSRIFVSRLSVCVAIVLIINAANMQFADNGPEGGSGGLLRRRQAPSRI